MQRFNDLADFSNEEIKDLIALASRALATVPCGVDELVRVDADPFDVVPLTSDQDAGDAVGVDGEAHAGSCSSAK